jgi:flagellar hook-basal body complex protein FliE
MYVSSIGAATTAVTPIEGANESAAVTQTPAESPAGVSFGDLFAKSIEEANRADHAASVKVDALAHGASDDLHGTMIAVKEADISIKLVGAMRNKLLDAFQELWKTSV